jgi:hypothetical protein
VSSGSKSSGKGAGGHARYVLRVGPYAKAREHVQEGATVRVVEIDKGAEMVYCESGNMPIWAAADPLRFWDASDRYERANGCVYREVEVALPRELSDAQQIALAQAFAKAVATVDGGVTPWTLAVHQQDPDHPENRHAHILVSDRIVDDIARSPENFFKRYNAKAPERGGAQKSQERQDTKAAGMKWTDRLRPLWENMANAALERAGIEDRIDHRTLEAQRVEQEAKAAKAMARGDEVAAVRHQRMADALDRPAQPKRGRVLTHAGPERAPERAAMLVDYEQAKAERQAVIQARREAEREAAEIERKEHILKKAKARQQERDPFDRMKIRGRWERRQKARQNRQRDAETAAEQRPGIRHPDRPQWQVYRERILAQAYSEEVAQALGRWVKVEREKDGLRIHNQKMDLMDRGDRITAGLGGNNYEIEAMLQLARAKGWKQIEFTGDEAFRERAGARALAAGFDLADADLKARIRDQQRQAAERRAAERAAIDPQTVAALAKWMERHPGQAANQRRAGGAIPGLGPDGVDLAELQRPEIWEAADRLIAERQQLIPPAPTRAPVQAPAPVRAPMPTPPTAPRPTMPDPTPAPVPQQMPRPQVDLNPPAETLVAGIRDRNQVWHYVYAYEKGGWLVGTLQRLDDSKQKVPLIFEKTAKGLEAIATFEGEKPLTVTLSKSNPTNGQEQVDITISRDGIPIRDRPGRLRENDALQQIPNHREGKLIQEALGVDPKMLKPTITQQQYRAPTRTVERDKGPKL